MIQNNSKIDKAIVPWGSNLSSNVGLPRFNPKIAAMIELPFILLGVVVGVLLSDGNLTFGGPRSLNAYFKLKQSLTHFEYLWFTFNLLSHYCKSFPALDIGFRNGVRTVAVYFNTRSLPCFTAIYSLFYNNDGKFVPLDIFNLLTPIALAHWIMGDGSHHNHGLDLCTNSFTTPDVVRLMNVLMIKYELSCTLKYHSSGGPMIYIKAESMGKLRTIVAPYMVKSMLYKIHL